MNKAFVDRFDKEFDILKIELIDVFDKVKTDYFKVWRNILEENDNDIVFLEPDWIEEWWDTFGKDYRLLLFVVSSKRGTEGIFPFMGHKKRFYEEVFFIGYPQAIYMDFIIRKEYRESAIRAVLNCLCNFDKKVIYNFSGIHETSPNYNILKKYLKDSNIQFSESSTLSPVIWTEGMDFDMYFKKNISSELKNKYRMYGKRLRELGKVSFNNLNEDQDDYIFKLHDMRWKKKLDTSMFSEEKSKKFFKKILHNKELHFKAYANLLNLDDRIIAFQLQFVYKGRYLYYRSAYDNLFFSYAPGKLILEENIRKCFLDSARVYDMGIGSEPYKYEWTDKVECVKSLLFAGKNKYTRLIYIIQLKWKLKDNLKKYRRIVNFKRNTLGEIRYLLSGENIITTLRKAHQSISILGFWNSMFKKMMGLLKKIFIFQTYSLFQKNLQDKVFDLVNLNITIRQASVDDVEFLSILMNCTAEKIMKRFFRKRKCFIASRGSIPINCMWVSFSSLGGILEKTNVQIEKNSACIYEIFTYGKDKSKLSIAANLNFILDYFKKNGLEIAYVAAVKYNCELVEVVRSLGFTCKKSIRIIALLNRFFKFILLRGIVN